MRGNSFLPFYINPVYMDGTRWKMMAELITWAKNNTSIFQNTKVLLPESCREAHHFLGDQVVTVPVKEGLATEAAILYPFEETRQALYEGAKRAMAAIDKCKPYKIAMPFSVKLEYVTPDENPEKIRSIEHTYPDATHIYDILREEKPKN